MNFYYLQKHGIINTRTQLVKKEWKTERLLDFFILRLKRSVAVWPSSMSDDGLIRPKHVVKYMWDIDLMVFNL
jgi:hypothetical protein